MMKQVQLCLSCGTLWQGSDALCPQCSEIRRERLKRAHADRTTREQHGRAKIAVGWILGLIAVATTIGGAIAAFAEVITYWNAILSFIITSAAIIGGILFVIAALSGK